LSNVAASAAVTIPGQTITLSPAVSVSDPDNLDLASATVQITAGAFAGDVLAANTSGTAIAASYNSTTETLTLSGNDTLADYQQVLDSVTFNSTSANPTNSGTDRSRTVTWTLNDGSSSNNLSSPATTTINLQTSVPYDFNADSVADFVFQQEGFNAGGTKGTPQIWLWNGTSVTSMTTIANPGATWHIVASADLNGDDKSDLIWQNDNGQPGVWLMNGATPIAEAGLANPGANWHLIAAGGNLMIDEMNGTTVTSSVSITVGDPSWHAVSTGTFNGVTEIAWQNTNGTPGIWLMNGTTPISEHALPNPGSSWQLISIGQFTPNGLPDLLWQNVNGAMGIWETDGINITGTTNLPDPGQGVLSLNGNQAVDPPGKGAASNASTANTASVTNTANTTNTASTTPNGTMRQSMPDVANAAPVSQNLLATSDPNSTQHLVLTGG
jgi:hypothetical protein